MTTIVSNGYYLASDHRISCSASSTIRHVDPKTLKPMKVERSIYLKLRLIENKVLSKRYAESGNIVAMVSSGAASLNACVFEILSNVKEFDHEQWKSSICRAGSHTVMMVTDKFHTFKLTVHQGSMTLTMHRPGEVQISGSGVALPARICDYIESSKFNIPWIMSLAACLDHGTSPEYSVFGVKEKLFYPNVSPSKEHVENLARAAWADIAKNVINLNHN